jgi:hypothetical protein
VGKAKVVEEKILLFLFTCLSFSFSLEFLASESDDDFMLFLLASVKKDVFYSGKANLVFMDLHDNHCLFRFIVV